MKPHIFVRDLSEEEQKSLSIGLRSSDAFVLRRSQILLASARGEPAPSIETMRQALSRVGINWKRAKRWITSPDPEYQRKKGDATA
jgi:hypothetical protein